MVVPFRERANAPVAVAILALLLASSMPIAPAQGDTLLGSANAYHLDVPQTRPVGLSEHIYVNQSGASDLRFLAGAKTFEVSFIVQNFGLQAAPRFPVYWWFQENDSALGCIRAPPLPNAQTQSVPAGRQGTKNELIPGQRMIQIDNLRLPTTILNEGAEDQTEVYEYHLNILVNREPVNTPTTTAAGTPRVSGFRSEDKQAEFRAECGTPDYGAEDGSFRVSGSSQRKTQTAPIPNTFSDYDASDNLIVVHLIKDKKMDLRVKTISWCRGPDTILTEGTPGSEPTRTDGPCGTTWTMSAGRWYNTSRQNETPLYSTVTQPGADYDVFNGTFFETEIINDPGTEETPSNATWTTAVAGHPVDVDHTTCPRVVGTDNTQWWTTNVSRTSASCSKFRFNLEFRVTAAGQNPATSGIILTNSSRQPVGLGTYRSKTLHLYEIAERFKTGDLQVLVNVNPLGNPAETVSSNNAVVQPFEVQTVDIQGKFNLTTTEPGRIIRTTQASPYTLDNTGRINIAGFLDTWNAGNALPLVFRHDITGDPYDDGEPIIRPLMMRVAIDNRTNEEKYHRNLSVANIGTSQSDWTRLGFSFSIAPNTDPKLGITPGIHGLCAYLDVGAPRTNDGVITTQNETNEANNQNCIAIYVQDTSAPVLGAIEGSSTPRITKQLWNGTTLSSIHANESFAVSMNVSDDDQEGLTVIASFQSDANQSIYRNYTMRRLSNTIAFPHTYSVTITDMGPSSNATASENWTLRVHARDAFTNNVTSGASKLEVKRWPIQTKNANHTVLGIVNETGGWYPEDSTFPYRGGPTIRFEFEVFDNETGYADQSNRTENFNFTVHPAGAASITVNGTRFDPQINCPTSGTLPPIGSGQGPRPNPCTGQYRFMTPVVERDLGGPGRWYVELKIMDKAGEVRVINRTYRLLDSLPVITNFGISNPELDAKQPLVVNATMTDDFGIESSSVNFTRIKDNLTFSFPLVNKTVIGNCASPPCGYSYNDSITTGYGNQLDAAGDYLVTFSTKDTQGNWNKTPGIPFTLKDGEAPIVSDAGVDQPSQELKVNVTFRATVTDATNVTVILRVHPAGSDEDTIRVNMTRAILGGANYTHTTNFTVEGSYLWSIWAEDSAGLVSSVMTGPITIARNLAPRFEIREPRVTIGGDRYGRAAATVSVLVYDTDDIERSTIKLRINGENVSFPEPERATLGLKGYLVNYTIPASAGYRHRDTITVNVSAGDLSVERFAGSHQFAFIVDARAPTTRVAEFAPKYRAQETDVFWNVSLKTKFTLTAADDDGLPTGIDSIHYRIYSPPVTSSEFVYSTPFTLDDRSFYSGPKNYQIQYWAVDAVGNVNRTASGQLIYETLNVYVDDQPPTINPFGSLPQGRFINVTYYTDESGVERVIVLYSVNGGAFQSVALDLIGGVWSTVLPEGRKGDTVRYFIEAIDGVGNKDETAGNATDPYATYIVGNHLPKLSITSPTTGTVIDRTVDLRWDASDEDGDDLTFTIYFKAPGRATFTELAKVESDGARSYPLDTTKLQGDGEYVIRITASDGSFVQPAEVTLSVLNRASSFGSFTPVPGEVGVNKPILLSVEVTKALAKVEARVYRDGTLVKTFAMNDLGRDGDVEGGDLKYSTLAYLDDIGDYKVQFHAVYRLGGEDRTDEIPGPSFAVTGTPTDIIRASGPWLAVIGLLAAAGVGIAAWVILRRK